MGSDDSCASRAVHAAAAGGVAGFALGAARSTWSPSAPLIVGGRSLPALARTGRIAGAAAATFALVGAVFATVDCAVEEFRGKHDAWNGFIGGAAAGTALGVRLPSAGATVGAALALGTAAAAVDIGGRSLVADRGALRAKVSAYPPPAAE